MKKSNRTTIYILIVLMISFQISDLRADAPEQTQQYKYALGLIQRQLYEEASKVLRRIISTPTIFSNADGAVFWLAECEYRQKNYTKAEGMYNQILLKFPNSIFRDRSAYGLGWSYTKNNNPKSAVEAFSKVTKNDDVKLWIDANMKRGFLMTKYQMNSEKTLQVYSEILKEASISTDQKYECHLQLGIGKFNKSIFKQAITHFLEALEICPPQKKQSILFYLAESYFRDRDFKTAENWYAKTIANDSQSVIAKKAQYSLAWCKIKRQKLDEAIKILKSIVGSPKSHARENAAKDLIEVYMNLHQYENAITWINKSLLFFGKNIKPDMLYLKGLALSRIGRFDKSLKTFDEFLKEFPKHDKRSEVIYQCGLSNISLNEFNKALECFKSISSDKTEPTIREKAIYRIGECYFNLGNLKMAGESFNKVLRVFPNGNAKYDTLYQLGEIAYMSNRYSDALAAFDTIGKIKSELAAQAIFRAGEVLMKAHNFTDAITRFETYLLKFPNGKLREDAIFKTGLSHIELKDQGKALASFSQLRDAKGYFRQEARYQIGQIAVSLKNYPLAVQQYQAILAEEPKHPLASRSSRAIGICFYKMNDYDSAVKIFQDLLKNYPSTDSAIPESQLWYGKSLIASGKIEDGIMEALKVPILYSQSDLVASSYLVAAEAYTKLGKINKARKMWKEVLKSKPTVSQKKLANNALAKSK